MVQGALQLCLCDCSNYLPTDQDNVWGMCQAPIGEEQGMHLGFWSKSMHTSDNTFHGNRSWIAPET